MIYNIHDELLQNIRIVYTEKKDESVRKTTSFKKYIEEEDNKLKEGMVFDISNSLNKLKVISKDKILLILFIRHDGIDTHISKSTTKYNASDIISKLLKKKLNYNLIYQEDREKFVSELLKQNEDWIIDLLSSDNMIKKEVKTKDSFLAENQKIDQLINKLIDYIYQPKYPNKKLEDCRNIAKQKLKNLTYNKENANKIYWMKEELNVRHSTEHKAKTKLRQVMETSLCKVKNIEEVDNSYREYNIKYKIPKKDFSAVKLKRKKKDESYWDYMYTNRSQETKEFKKGLYNTFMDAILNYKNKLGYGDITHCADCGEFINIENSYVKLNKECKCENIKILKENHEKEQFIKDYKKKIDNRNIKYIYNEDDYKIDGNKYFSILKGLHDNAIGDFRESEPMLLDRIPVANKYVYTPNLTFDSDTWYENEQGETIEVNRSTVSFSNVNTYKGLLLTYFDLNKKYYDKPEMDMWSILKDFKNIVKETEFNDYQKLIVRCLIIDNYTNTNSTAKIKLIKEEYDKTFGTNIGNEFLSRQINEYIPNMLLETYNRITEEWVYENKKVKGEYKICSKCGESKLLNDRYFSKRSDEKGDGFYSYCRICGKVQQ